MNHYNLPQPLAKYLAETTPETFTWMGMLKEQPPEGWRLHPACKNTSIIIPFVKFVGSAPEWIDIKLPFPIGSIVGMPEKFGYVWPDSCEDGMIYDDDNYDGRPIRIDEMSIVYYANDPDFIWWSDYTDDNECKMWRSATQMPSETIRHHYKVTSTRVCQVGDVTADDVCKWLWESASTPVIGLFKQWFNDRYSKPRPRQKKGKIVSWECWCTDMYYWAEKYAYKSCYEEYEDGSSTWKDNLLIIHVNPWFVINEGERE